MGIFGKAGGISLAGVRPSTGGGYYYPAGEFEAEVETIQIKKTRAKGQMFLVETICLASSTPDVVVGSRPSITMMLEGKAADVSPKKILDLLSALVLLDARNPKHAKVIARMAEEGKNGEPSEWDLVGESALLITDQKSGDTSGNGLKGGRFHISATSRVSKGGNVFTAYIFSPPKEPADFQLEMQTDCLGGN